MIKEDVRLVLQKTRLKKRLLLLLKVEEDMILYVIDQKNEDLRKRNSKVKQENFF